VIKGYTREPRAVVDRGKRVGKDGGPQWGITTGGKGILPCSAIERGGSMGDILWGVVHGGREKKKKK